ncbi:MAG: hypothetical protein M1818_006532 [Claussenomyces sp. TS43310]|nr:MAG: hypothetical protein M1818_006532 [Claussenomyces sp. TS43310]
MKLAPEGHIALLNYTYEIEGPHLERAVQQIAELLEAKNSILRTTIVRAGANFVQVLLAKRISSFVYTSDYCLVRNDKTHGKTFFVISIHHMVSDGFSRYLIEKELRHILRSPETYADVSERPRYGGFASHLRASRPEAQVLQYWDKYLQGSTMATIHPSQPESLGYSDGAVVEVIPARTLQARSHAGQTDIILAAWSLALYRYSGLRDVVFGMLRHGRSHPYEDTRRMIGPIMCSTPFRMKFEQGNESSDRILHRVQDELLSTVPWEQDYVPGVADGYPLAQSIINLKSELYAMPEGSEDVDKKDYVSRLFVRHDLQDYEMNRAWAIYFVIHQNLGNFSFQMYYSSPLLPHDKAETLFKDFLRLVKELGSSQTKTLDELICVDFEQISAEMEPRCQ